MKIGNGTAALTMDCSRVKPKNYILRIQNKGIFWKLILKVGTVQNENYILNVTTKNKEIF